MNPEFDIAANRRAAKWTRKELLGRVLWRLFGAPLFRLSPRPLWGWRRALLRAFGARIGAQVQVHPTVRVTIPWNVAIGDHSAVGDRAILYALGPIAIGARVTISQGAHLCAGTHDWRRPDMMLVKSSITVGDDSWICADAFIGPDITVSRNAIVGARAVALEDVPAGAIVLGNPGKVVSWKDRKAPGA